MRASSVFFAAIFLAVNTWAATVTNPTQGTVWDAKNQDQAVAWTSVPSDPSSFTLVLANNVVYPNINIVLQNNVSTAIGSAMPNAPPSGWPTGNGFQINIVQDNPNGVAILAQSQQFNITGTTVPFSSTSSRPSGTSTGTSPGSTNTGSGKNGELGLTVQTGFVAGLALVGALLA